MSVILVLSALGIATLISGVFHYRRALLPVTLFGVALAFVLNLGEWGGVVTFFADVIEPFNKGMLDFDAFAFSFSGLLLFATLLIISLSQFHIQEDLEHAGEFFAILLFTLLGGVVMVSYSNLVMLFIGIEILSISLYVLAGSRKYNVQSNEASVKYFLLGSFASGFLLLGIALIYGVTGSLSLEGISDYIGKHSGTLPFLGLLGIMMIIVGMAFKVSAVPFHSWAPDVYEGSPTVITAFMATVVKTAAVAAFLRLMLGSFAAVQGWWTTLLAVIAILTMTIGNVTALYQTNFKRLMAYSGISHAGYLLIGIVALTYQDSGISSSGAILYYTLGYAVASIAAFAVLLVLAGNTGDSSLHFFNGLAKRDPLLATGMTVCLLSLAGIPPLAGFFGKYYLFLLAIHKGLWVLAAFAILNSLIGIYYYFIIMINMFLKDPQESQPVVPSPIARAVVGVCVLLTIVAGLFPEGIINLLS
ncbi:MAG: NADH-quinone oxidoreductase subunit N [Chitinophagales bacterium]|nr:MAG: NADH-quinone oxidoreductase subunit N [Chitinophagales bacterium]